MVRWEPGHKDATKKRILDAAARLFRERGYANTGVADVMRRAGLTVGGFYAHFDSKERLLSAVLAHAFDRTQSLLLLGLDAVEGAQFVREVTRRYLSRTHRDHAADGCALPALAAEVGREGAPPRKEIERYLLEWVERVAEKAPPHPTLSAQELALAITALSVGGVLLARAVHDESLSNTILKACRRLAAAEDEP